MAEAKKTLLRHLHTLKALDREIRSAIDQQQRDKRLQDQNDVARLVERIENTLAPQSERLEKRIEALGGDTLTGEIKERLGQIVGFGESLWQNLRDEPVSISLRDHYAALNLAAIHYTMLHASAVALQDTTTADLAYQHLREITPLVVETSQVMPLVVVAETAAEHEGVDLTSATDVVKTTQKAWQSDIAKTAKSAPVTTSATS